MIDLGKLLQSTGFAIAMLATGIVADANTNVSQSKYLFKVFLDGKEIGTHKVELSELAGKKQVTIEADFDVRIFFISVYRYRHTNSEVWNGQCLDRIEAATDANGEDFFITSGQAGESLRLVTHNGTHSLDGCVRSFAYWDPSLLRSEKLLNTQTGEYVTADLEEIGYEVVRIGDTTIQVKRYQLVTSDGVIDLWYTSDNRWVALESKTSNGMILRYEAQSEEGYATANL